MTRTCLLLLALSSLYVVTFAAGNEHDASAHRQAASDARPALGIPRTSRPPTIDDFVSGRAREAEAQVSGFRQREPHDGLPASEDTSAFLSYDASNLYVVFVCKDAPANVRARMAKREDISEDDRVTIYLDSFYDGQRAYVFSSNAFGVQRDGMATEGQGTDFQFDMIWHAKGQITADGFVVWMAIPFKSLRFPRAAVQRWGIALSRTIQRNAEGSYWPYITRKRVAFMGQMATLDGLEHVSGARDIEVNPYATFTGTRLLDTRLPGFADTRVRRWGVDSKLILRNAAALDLTVNPDFSQVESDDPQAIVNQRYEVVFPEKRPFFLENAGYFQTPINLFFSRRVADPSVGARLTGKFGRWGVAVLAADDRADGQRADPTSPLFGDRAAVGVARVQRDFATDSRVGVLVNARDFGAVRNNVASVDTRLGLSPNWYFTGQAAYSVDQDNERHQRTGTAYSARLSHGGEHFSYEAGYLDISPEFRSQLGFIPRVDLRRTEQYAGYFWRPTSSGVLSFGPSVSIGANWDHAGRLQDWWGNADVAIDFAGPAGLSASRYEAYERYLGNEFRIARTSVSGYLSTAKWLTVDGSYGRGDAINYSPAGSLNPFLGDSHEASLGVTVRPTTRLIVQEQVNYNAFRSPRRLIAMGVPSRIFDNQFMRTKIHVQLTRALSVRTIVDYYGLLPDSTLFAADRYQQLSGDILLTWLVHPGTAVYAGFNNRLENVLFDPTTLAVRLAAPRLGTTGQQAFVKLNYLFRM